MSRIDAAAIVAGAAFALWLFLRGLGSVLAWVARTQDRRDARGH